MKVIVKALDKTIVDVSFEDTETPTIQDLKNKLQVIKNHPVEQMLIIYNGQKLLEDGKKLSEYGIKDGTSVVLMMTKAKPTPPPVPASVPIPVSQQPQSEPTAQPAVQPTAQPAGGAHANFANILQQNPQQFLQMLMSNPQIAAMAQQNPAAFAQILADPNFLNNIVQVGEGMEGDEEDPMYEKVFEGDVELTDAQKKEVEEIVAMGFGSFEDTVQYYVALGYNKDATVNALLDNKFNDDF